MMFFFVLLDYVSNNLGQYLVLVSVGVKSHKWHEVHRTQSLCSHFPILQEVLWSSEAQ